MKSEPVSWHPCLAISVSAVLSLLSIIPAFVPEAAAQLKDPGQTSKQLLGQISGHVYRFDTGEPIAKAEVSLHPEDENTSRIASGGRTVRTLSDGTFVFSDIPPGSYALDVWRNGFADFSCQKNRDCKPFSLGAGQKLQNLVLRLTPAGVIAGRVSDEDQEAVAGVEVYALRVNFLRGGGREINAVSQSVTDDQGNFRIAGMQPGRYYLRAGGLIERPMKHIALKQGPGGRVEYRDTYYPGTPTLDDAEPLDVRAGVERNDIRFSVTAERTYTVSGKVLNTNKRSSKESWNISATKWGEVAEQTFGFAHGTSQYPDGSFTVWGLSPGEYTLTASRVSSEGKELDGGFAQVQIVDSDVRADIEIGRAAEVHGTVEAPSGTSFLDKRIILQANGGSYHPSKVDSAGRFDIANVPPGVYTLAMLNAREGPELAYLQKAVCDGKDYALQSVVLGVGTVLDCEILIGDDAGVVGGQVKDGGKSVPGLMVVLIPESRDLRRIPRYTLTAKTDAKGRYRLPGAIPGDYFLFAVAPSDDHSYFAVDFSDRNQDSAVRIKVDPRATQDFDLRPTQEQ